MVATALGLAATLAAGGCAKKQAADDGLIPTRLGKVAPAPEPPSPSTMPSLRGPWAPPMLSSGSVDGLAATLARYPSLAIMTGPGYRGNLWEKRTFQLVQSLSPQTEVLARGDAEIQAIMEERGEIAIRQNMVPSGSADLWGRPTYVVQNIPLNTDWLDRQGRLMGAQAFLMIDGTAFNVQEWRNRPQYPVGDCRAPMAELERAKADGAAALGPFRAWFDGVLAQAFDKELKNNIGDVARAVRKYESPTPPYGSRDEMRAYECGHYYWQAAQPFLECEHSPATCDVRPRLAFDQGMHIAYPQTAAYAPDDCPARFGRDIIEELHQLGQRASRAAVEKLDPAWLSYADGVAALDAIEHELEGICVPQRRRFAPPDIGEAQRRLTEVGEALQSPASGAVGQWVGSEGTIRTADTGVMELLLSFRSGPQSPGGKAREKTHELAQFVRGAAKCTQTANQMPLTVAVVDVGTSAVGLLGFFYEEELFCPGMPPLLANAAQAGGVGGPTAPAAPPPGDDAPPSSDAAESPGE